MVSHVGAAESDRLMAQSYRSITPFTFPVECRGIIRLHPAKRSLLELVALANAFRNRFDPPD